MKNKSFLILALIFISFFAISAVYGQPFNPPDGEPMGDPVGAPIDGGISALIAAGVALVARKFWKNRKAKKAEQ